MGRGTRTPLINAVEAKRRRGGKEERFGSYERGALIAGRFVNLLPSVGHFWVLFGEGGEVLRFQIAYFCTE